MSSGILYLIPTLLDDAAPQVLSQQIAEVSAPLTVFFVENERTARRGLRKAGYSRPFEEVTLHVLDKDTTSEQIAAYIQILKSGISAGVLSEAGVPCVADPGAALVREAHRQQVKVVPLTGPSSILLALMASGMNGQSFAFQGYLPVDRQDREAAIRRYEKLVYSQAQTQIFIETPYRNKSLLTDLVQVCRPETLLCVAAGLTGPGEWIRTQPVGLWRKAMPDLGKIPAIFLLGL